MKNPPPRGRALMILLRRPGSWIPSPLFCSVVRSDQISGALFTRIPRRSRSVLKAMLTGSAPAPEALPDLEERRGEISDRRSERRAYDARLAALSSQLPYLLVARDLSLEGLRVDPLPWAQIGTRLEVSFPVPGQEIPIGLPVIVLRQDGRRGTILRFAELEPGQEQALRALLMLLPELHDDREVILLTEVA